MDTLLPLLIDRATELRDQQARLSREAAAAAAATQTTLGRLEHFRQDSLARLPAATGQATDAQALVDGQRFMSRLDDAIALQRLECERREQRSAAGQQQLVASQRRLLAFEALVQRRAAAAQAREQRRAQQASDEFAARAAQRRLSGGFA
jgi:flagellar FliJ protein